MKKITLIFLSLMLSYGISAQNLPYIYKVYEYCPAPGQYINDIPEYETGDSYEDILARFAEYIQEDQTIAASLGAWGGYIVFGFDHPVVNVKGERDFRILGNAFWAEGEDARGGSSEPGIVLVSVDVNNDGIPNDEWYELAGSEYDNQGTYHDYEITYYKPSADHEPSPDPNNKFITDKEYIRWTDNNGEEGYVYKNAYHKQSYWPEWIDEETLTFRGSRLPDNYVDKSGDGTLYVQYAYQFGYADNAPDSDEASALDIEWAVDKNGNKVDLKQIDFIKVYTAVNQSCGWLGESSTEVFGAIDLHPDATSIDYISNDEIKLLNNPVQDYLILNSQATEEIFIYDMQGRKLSNDIIYEGTNQIDCSYLKPGLYLLITSSHYKTKFLKR